MAAEHFGRSHAETSGGMADPDKSKATLEQIERAANDSGHN